MLQTNHILANVIIPSHTGLPRDSVVHGFRFWPKTTADPDPAAIGDILNEFFNTDPDDPPGGSAIASYYNGRSFLGAADGAILSLAEVITASGDQTPADEFPFTINSPGPDTSSYLPLEVAICLSFVGSTPSLETAVPVTVPRRRGRIYLGPFTSSVLANPGTGDLYPEVDPGFVSSLTFAAQRLMASADAIDLTWCIYSRAARQVTAVTSGWVDNEFDTQRRRQVKADTRTAWGFTA